MSKLAGIIAHRRDQLAVARAKFEESRRLDRLDCETGFYLGGVLGEQGAWAQSASVLAETSGCLEDAERGLLANIDRIRQADIPPERRTRQIASREKQVAAGRLPPGRVGRSEMWSGWRGLTDEAGPFRARPRCGYATMTEVIADRSAAT